MSATLSLSTCYPASSLPGPSCSDVDAPKAGEARRAGNHGRLMGLASGLRLLLRPFRPSTWRVADVRDQERIPLSELTRRMPMPPLSF